MIKKITYGKIIAFIIGVAIALFVWNIFFPPGGLAANIVLGIFLAFMFVQYFVDYFGGIIDQEFFPRGSKKRARLYRELSRFVKESSAQLLQLKKNNKRRAKVGEKNIQEFESSINKCQSILEKVSLEWENNNVSMQEHERLLESAYYDLELKSKSIFSLSRNWHFLYGMPSLLFALFVALILREFVLEPYQIPSGSMIPTLLPGDHLFVLRGYYGLSKPFVEDTDFFIKWSKPKVGDVVVFKAPSYVGRHAGQAWIKRVVATEGQTIKIVDHTIFVDDQPYSHVSAEKIDTYMDFFGFGGPDGGSWKEQQARHTIEQIGSLTHQIYLPLSALDPRVGPNWPVKEISRPGLICSEVGCKVKKGHVFVMGDNRGNSHDSRGWGALPISRIKGKAAFVWLSVDGSKQSIKLGPFSLPRFRWERFFTSIH